MAKARSLLAKNKAAMEKAFNAHKEDETKLSGGDLPAGIDNGIAQLESAYISEHDDGDNKGKPYMMIIGTVLEPEEYKGLKAQRFIALYDTDYTSLDDNVAKALNEMRKMGIETAELDVDDWEETLEQLQEEAPVFRFRTWKGKPTKDFPDPRVNTDFRGLVEDYEPSEEEDVEEEEGAEEDDLSYAELGEMVDNVGEDAERASLTFRCSAQSDLEAAAEEHELDPNDYETWASLGEELDGLEDPEEGEEEEEEPEEEEPEEEEPEEEEPEEEEVIEPEKDDQCGYKPPRKRNAVDVTVTAVYKTKETCNVKEIETGKVHKGVAWSDLIWED